MNSHKTGLRQDDTHFVG